MKNKLLVFPNHIRPFWILLFFIGFAGCESHLFESDHRQIMSKDAISSQLKKAQDFDILSFHEDSVRMPGDSNFKVQIQYTLDFEYVDSNKVLQNKKGIVMFTPDGKAIISTKIIDP